MALKPCRECAKDVSEEAATCPHCGIKGPVHRKQSGCLPIAVGLLGVIAFMALVGSLVGPEHHDSGSQSLPEIGAKQTVSSSALACLSEDTFDRLSDFATKGDDEAYSAEVTNGIMSGTCITLRKGDVVFISDVSVWHGITRVRPLGKTAEYWAYTSAITGK